MQDVFEAVGKHQAGNMSGCGTCRYWNALPARPFGGLWRAIYREYNGLRVSEAIGLALLNSSGHACTLMKAGISTAMTSGHGGDAR